MKKKKYVYNSLKFFLISLRHPYLKKAFNINSHLTIEEKIQLYKISRNLNFIAEIGSFTGASANCFLAHEKHSKNKKVICIDTWNNDAMSEGLRDTWDEFCTNTNNISQKIIPIRGYSNEVVQKVSNITKYFDLLFIDGDHSYEGVKRDWENYKSFLKPSSIIVFHDYGWASGVKRVVHEDVIHTVSISHYLPNMWWGVVKNIL